MSASALALFLIITLVSGLHDEHVLGDSSSKVLHEKSNVRAEFVTENVHENAFVKRDTTGVPFFKKVFLLILENQPIVLTMKDNNFSTLAAKGTLLTDYNALINPSQPNYIAMTAGDNLNVISNDMVNLTQTCIVDLLEEKGVSWKAYMENYPGNCFAGSQTVDGLYKRKHNPFISFNQVRENPDRCAKIVNADQLKLDIAANNLSQYSYYTPNMNNDGHDTGLNYAGRWVTDFLSTLLDNRQFMEDMLLVVTFDEGIKPDNRIYTLLLGDMIPPGNIDATYYTHYSVLRLIEDAFSLPTLGRLDDNATRINTTNFIQGKYTPPGTSTAVIVGGAITAIIITSTIAVLAYAITKRRQGSRKTDFTKLEQEEFLEPLDEDEHK